MSFFLSYFLHNLFLELSLDFFFFFIRLSLRPCIRWWLFEHRVEQLHLRLCHMYF